VNPAPEGLGRELFVRLALPLLAIAAVAGLLGALTAQRLVDHVFDRWLLDGALSMAAQVRVENGQAHLELPPAALGVLAFDVVDRMRFNATQGGRVLVGSTGLPDEGAREAVYAEGRAFDADVGGTHMRVALVDACPACAEPVRVRFAETTTKRERARAEVLAMLGLVLVLLAAAGLTTVFALRRTVGGLARIAAQWNQQSTASLAPVGTDGVPRELRPFALALNQLLARIRAMLVRERGLALSAAHQLRTRLASLQLGLARAADAPDLPAARAVIAELHATAQRTARLVQQLLAIGGLDPERRGELAVAPTDLVALAHDVGATMIDAAIARGVTLELREPEHPVHAAVQADLVGEALANLVDNALRHTPAGGRIEIAFEGDPPAVRVEDSGPGIAPEVRERAFEPFVRGRDSGTGTGLGLAIVRDIAHLHGATVEIGSSPLGGASVTIRFPRDAGGAATPAVPTRAAASAMPASANAHGDTGSARTAGEV
jgi:two-component system sensor histidine kinase TctE